MIRKLPNNSTILDEGKTPRRNRGGRVTIMPLVYIQVHRSVLTRSLKCEILQICKQTVRTLTEENVQEDKEHSKAIANQYSVNCTPWRAPPRMDKSAPSWMLRFRPAASHSHIMKRDPTAPSALKTPLAVAMICIVLVAWPGSPCRGSGKKAVYQPTRLGKSLAWLA